jgi:hypothetical protein
VGAKHKQDLIAAASPYKFECGFPAAGTAERAYDTADLRRAIEAYKFFYPTVATEAVMQQGLAAGAKVNEVGTVMATSPRQQFGGANADTPYAITAVDLKASGPMVAELPAGPFIGFVDDHNTWEDKIDYWRQLHAVIQTEAALAEYRPTLGMLASLGIEQGKPFNPDARTQRILEKAARTALAEMRIVFYASRNPAHIAWKDRTSEWFPLQLISAETGDFGVPA